MNAGRFYKATRPDGTDFYSGTVDYAAALTSGGLLRAPGDAKAARLCGPGYLHAATVPAMSLVGGKWPCRLFAVEGSPKAGLDSEQPHKAGFRQLRVVEELPAWQALGPNGEQVAALIDRAGRLTPDETRRLAAARAAAWDAARNAAWAAARAAARDAARDVARDAARAAAWDAARNAARAAAWGIEALVVRDLITPEQFNLLHSPWASVVGEPVPA